MAMKRDKIIQQELDELMEQWDNVYAVNRDYGWLRPTEEDVKVTAIGFNVSTLKDEQEVDILITMTPEDACFMIEDFLNVYPELNYPTIKEYKDNKNKPTLEEFNKMAYYQKKKWRTLYPNEYPKAKQYNFK